MSTNPDYTVTVQQPLTVSPPDATTFYDRINSPLDAVKTMGDWIAHSGMFGCVKPEQGYVLALECLANRQTPLAWKVQNHLINGNITMKSEAMLAGMMNAGWDIDWIQFDAAAAVAEFVKGTKKVRVEFTSADAKLAGMLPAKPGSGWAKFPAEMLRARVISKATRMLDPRITQGRYTPEEVADFSNSPIPTQSAPSVTVQPVVPTAPTVNQYSLVEKLEIILEEHADIANKFLIYKNLINEGQNFRDVSSKVASMIVGDAEGFIKKAYSFAAESKGAQ
ncbi:MAG: hypothetical protein WCK04_00990 [Actinomycetes bacterium]